MENEKLLELCDEKINLTKELQDTLDEETLLKIRRLILIEKQLNEYVILKDKKEEIEIL